MSDIERCPCRQCAHHGKTWEQIAAEQKAATLPERRKMKERALTAENQLQGAIDALRALLVAQDDAYAASLSGSGRAPEAIERLANARDAARAIVGGSKP